MNSLISHDCIPTNRALGPVIGPDLQFTKSSGYSVEQLRHKAEQSETSDIPLQALTIEMREGILAASGSTIRSPFGEAPAIHFRRTAHALATLEPAQTKTEQEATMGALPAFISKISLGLKKEKPALHAVAPRRQLLPPPKTVFLPCGDPGELRRIVEETQQKRNQALQAARITTRMPALPPLEQQCAFSPVAYAVARIKNMPWQEMAFRARTLLGDLIDKMAVA